MSARPFSPLMRLKRLALHGASQMLDGYPALGSNTADKAFGRTMGGATLADSSVVPSSRSQATSFSVTPRSQTKVAVRQLRKEGR